MKLVEFYVVKKIIMLIFMKDFFRIKLDSNTLLELEKIIIEQFNYFKNDKLAVNYAENVEHEVNSEEVFFINSHDYIDNSKLIDLFENTTDIEKINKIDDNSFSGARSFAFALKDEDKYYLLFQQFKKSYLFINKKIITYSNENFSYKNDYFIVLPDYISFYYDFSNKNIYFRKSYHVNSTIDLSPYYKEATNSDIENKLISKDSIFSGNYEFLSQNQQKNKKKITLLIENNIINKAKEVDFDILKDMALQYGVNLVKENDKIIIPEDNKELDDFISFFNDEMYQSIFGDTKYKASGKKKIINENNMNKN
ncbi:hypothetical protein OFR41_05490 [Brachyspira hyodysenteriae]|uniref:hypothetical protein n=1 Tax=Brachyspira hyodysenteriae TaxID=159 RepID=UPI0022CD9536|nr:hypothetical protein [Brachyspira hyodysenteriae]MDA0034581.1 hypothetical protein [Brachyspira hyodysenteriae]MDA0048656.1 hypothetical protein [Brachyspira hyodysenteriae]